MIKVVRGCAAVPTSDGGFAGRGVVAVVAFGSNKGGGDPLPAGAEPVSPDVAGIVPVPFAVVGDALAPFAADPSPIVGAATGGICDSSFSKPAVALSRDASGDFNEPFPAALCSAESPGFAAEARLSRAPFPFCQ
jgi:hypothetical protein